MSEAYFTFSRNKFESLFFNILFFRLAWINWPEGMSYTAWQNLLKSYLHFIGTSRNGSQRRPRNKKGLSRRYRKFLQKLKLSEKTVQQQMSVATTALNEVEPIPTLELITLLKKFYERKNIAQHIEETIPDHRNQDLITYSKQSIMMCALAIFLFRVGSGNKFCDKSHDDDEKYSTTNMSKFISAPEDRVPVIKTIEKFLKNLGEESINDLMIAFFKDLQGSKFFKQHPQIMPGDFFLLAADCVHTHTYDHPHHIDMEGNNNCQYCLKRIYNKETEKETVRWLHNTLVFSFVFLGGLKIPIYRYPIHAKQIVGFESKSEDVYKQECELVALKTALPMIRRNFPRMNLVLLLDGLYANKPVIRLVKEQRCGYIIVRKESCLTLLGKECDEIANQTNHKKNCVRRCQKIDAEGWKVKQKYEWFNGKYLGEDVVTNVLRFQEYKTRADKTKLYKCEWLFSWKLSAKICELAVRQARARWEIEDLFNSLKNRDYNLKHDYSRDPRSCFNWQGLSLFAFGIFELFRFSEVVKKRGDWPQTTLAEKLLGQLLYRPTEELFSERCLLIRPQFRYHFAVEKILYKEMDEDRSLIELETG